MEYEIFQIKDDGSKLEVPIDKMNEALVPGSVIILIDHTRRKIYNFNGKESSIRVRFIGARMAAGPIRGELGLTYTVNSIDEGEETNEFRECLKSIASPGSAAVSRILDRPPPPPPPLMKSSSSKPTKDRIAEVNTTSLERDASYPDKVATPADYDIDSLVKEFGEIPEGHEVEAIIVKDAVYKNFSVQTKVFGKEVEQTRLERVKDVDGLFTLEGKVRIIAKNGTIAGVQILSKERPAPSKRTKAGSQ